MGSKPGVVTECAKAIKVSIFIYLFGNHISFKYILTDCGEVGKGLFAVENNCCDFLDLAEAQKLYPETSFNHRSAAFCHRQVEISVIVPQ